MPLMGFTAVNGLPMRTRTGALGPGVVLHLLQREGTDAKRAACSMTRGGDEISHRRGLSGL